MGLFSYKRNQYFWDRIPAASDENDTKEHLLHTTSVDTVDLEEHYGRESEPSHGCRWCRTRTHLCLTAVNVTVLMGTISLIFLSRGHNTPSPCAEVPSSYTPVLVSSPVHHSSVRVNGTLWLDTNPSWSRAEPGDAWAEAVWDSFEPIDTFPITREEVLTLGKDPETAVRYPDEEWGLGDDAYMASLDITHKVHCLNELRKMTFADYGDEGNDEWKGGAGNSKNGHSQLWWIHLRHCVDMLAQDIMCHADRDVYTFRWMDTQDYPYPDFNINRKCASVDDVLKWKDEHKVDLDKFAKMEKPSSGIRQVPNEPGYYAMYGFEGSDLFPNGKGYPQLPESTWFGTKATTHIAKS